MNVKWPRRELEVFKCKTSRDLTVKKMTLPILLRYVGVKKGHFEVAHP